VGGTPLRLVHKLCGDGLKSRCFAVDACWQLVVYAMTNCVTQLVAASHALEANNVKRGEEVFSLCVLCSTL
jgi:cytochrome c2